MGMRPGSGNLRRLLSLRIQMMLGIAFSMHEHTSARSFKIAEFHAVITGLIAAFRCDEIARDPAGIPPSVDGDSCGPQCCIGSGTRLGLCANGGQRQGVLEAQKSPSPASQVVDSFCSGVHVSRWGRPVSLCKGR